MSYIFRMPKAGEGITEGEIVKWTVAVGDNIEEDSTIVEIQNDKLVQEVPSPVTGKITKILVEEGSVAQVGDALAEVDAPGYTDTEAVADDSTINLAKELEEKPQVEVKPKVETKASSSTYLLTLPKAGEGITEGEILEWKVAVGDTIVEDQTLLEVQNDKLVQEIPSTVNGVVKEILVPANTVAQVGQAILEITVDGDIKQDEVVETQTEPALEAVEAQATKTSTGSSVVSGRVLAMPSVRQYARDKNIAITEVSGTGKHNHITKDDVDNFTAKPSTAVVEEAVKAKAVPTQAVAQTPVQPQRQAHAVAQTNDTTRESMSQTRRAISRAMVKSKAHAPHVTIFDEVEVSKLMDHRRKFKDIAAKQDIKLTYLAYMTKAVVAVLRKYPILNASVDEATDEIVYKNYYSVGIAVDTDHGLYVPNIKDADRKGIFTVASEISELAEKTHNQELTMDEMTNGSTTISNIGSAWGMWFTPIINFPEVAIFGMGRIEKKPIVLEDGTLGVGDVLYLSMSFDHRIIDGSVAQLAMNELKRLMADPEVLMMEG